MGKKGGNKEKRRNRKETGNMEKFNIKIRRSTCNIKQRLIQKIEKLIQTLSSFCKICAIVSICFCPPKKCIQLKN